MPVHQIAKNAFSMMDKHIVKLAKIIYMEVIVIVINL